MPKDHLIIRMIETNNTPIVEAVGAGDWVHRLDDLKELFDDVLVDQLNVFLKTAGWSDAQRRPSPRRVLPTLDRLTLGS